MRLAFRIVLGMSLVVGLLGVNRVTAQQAEQASAAVPTLWIIGDSTVKNGTRGQRGWGEAIGGMFDASKVRVVNRAIGGRSSRTFITEGRWQNVLDEAKPGDFVLIQFGHNDGGPLDDPARARGTIRGTGDETKEIDNPLTRRREVVHTYGWYLRKYVADAREEGMTPIICSPVAHVPREVLKEGEVEKSPYVAWSAEVAKAQMCPFIDLNRIIMSRYMGMTPAEVKAKYFTPADNTHTSAAGAAMNAACVVEGIRSLQNSPLADYLLAGGK